MLVKTEGVGAIEKVLDIVELVAKSPAGLMVSELAETSGLPRPTVYRLLSALTKRRYLAVGADRRVRVGLAFLRIGSRVQIAEWIRATGRPLLWELARVSNCSTAQIAVLDDASAVFVDRAGLPGTSFRINVGAGDAVPLYCTAAGKALLAQLPSAEATAILRVLDLQPRTPATPTSIDKLEREIAEVRGSGVATSVAEYSDDVWSVAAPVSVDVDGRRYAIGVSEHMWKYSPQRLQEVSRLVHDTAQRLSEAFSASSRQNAPAAEETQDFGAEAEAW
jgi:DNA-binding IclR family transcriptional regulator